MRMTFDYVLKSLSADMLLDSMTTSLSEWNDTAIEKNISKKDIRKLSDAISFLPIEGQNLLIGNYVFNLTDTGMESIFDIKNAGLKLIFFEHLLAESLKLQPGFRINDRSMESACKKALWKIVNSFEKNHKTDILSYIIKTVAAVFLIGILSFGTVMSVNAEFREYIIKWFIEVTEQYTLFNLESSNPVDPLEQNIYIPTYIPERYHIYRSDVLPGFISYTYEDENQDVLNISISEPDTNAYLNTENMTKEKITINGAPGYLYHDGTYGSLVTNIDGYALYVTGKASKEEFIKIAEGVIKK